MKVYSNKTIPQEAKKISSKQPNITTQNLWDAAKAVLRGKFMMIKSYLKKQEKHCIDRLALHLKQLEKEEQ